MKNIFKRIIGYSLGFACINTAIPHVGLREFCAVTIGGIILILVTLLFKDN